MMIMVPHLLLTFQFELKSLTLVPLVVIRHLDFWN